MMWAERNLPSLQVAKWKAYTPIIAAKKRSRSSYCFHQSISNPHFHCSPRSKSPTKAGASCKAKVVFWNGHWMAISSQIITVAERLITPPMIHSLKRTNIAAHPPKKQMQVEVTLEKSSSPSNFNRGFATVSGKAKMFQKKTLLKIHTMTFKNAFLKAGLRSPCFYHPNSNPTSYSFVKFARKNCTSWRHVKSWICSNELVIARHLVIILESDDKSFSPDFGGRKI